MDFREAIHLWWGGVSGCQKITHFVINVTLSAESLQCVGDDNLHFYSRVMLQGGVLAILQDCCHSLAVVFLVHRGPSLIRRNNDNVSVTFEALKSFALYFGQVGPGWLGSSWLVLEKYLQ